MKNILQKVGSFIILLATILAMPFIAKINKVNAVYAEESAVETEEDTGSKYYGRETWGTVVVNSGSTYTMNGGSIQNADARFGSAFYVKSGATLNIIGGQFYHCNSKYGTIYVEDGGILNISGSVDFVANTTENTNVDYNGNDLPIYMENKTDLVEGVSPLTFTNVDFKGNTTVDVYDIEVVMHIDGVETARTYLDKDTQYEEMLSTLTEMTNSAGEKVFKLSNINGFFADENARLDILDNEVLTENSSGRLNIYSRTATKDLFTYTVTDGECLATAVSGASGEVVIPATNVDGVPITSFTCNSQNGITDLVMGENINSLEQNSFLFTKIAELYITNKVLNYTPKLYTDVTNKVAMRGSSKLEKIIVSVYNTCFSDFGCNVLVEVDANAIKLGSSQSIIPAHVALSSYKIENCAFVGCGIKNIDLPDGVTFGNDVFAASEMEEITLPASAEKVPYAGFSCCVNLKRVYLAEGITSVSNSAFFNCVSLEYVQIPSTMKSIAAQSFGRSNVSIFIFPEITGYMELNPFSGSNLKQIYLPKTIGLKDYTDPPLIGAYDQSPFRNMQNVIIYTNASEEEAVEIWGEYWNYCTSTTKCITVYNFVPEDGQTVDIALAKLNGYAIEGTVLTGYTGSDSVIIIPEGITDIGESVFASNTTITSLYCPTTLTKIGANAFSGCSALEYVKIYEGVTEVGENAFNGCTALVEFDSDSEITISASEKNIVEFYDSSDIVKDPYFVNIKKHISCLRDEIVLNKKKLLYFK